MIDRTTKILLGLIATALWGIVLRPVVAPAPASAQNQIQAVEVIRPLATWRTAGAPFFFGVETFQEGPTPNARLWYQVDNVPRYMEVPLREIRRFQAEPRKYP